VTLLLLWVVVVPALTLACMYVVTGVLGRRLRARAQGFGDRSDNPPRRLTTHLHRARAHMARTRDHALIQR
jgi:hypothetical protein